MRQFILPETWDGGETCLIEGDRAHYVARVLRLGVGDGFPGRDARGRPWSCAVLESAPGRLLLSVYPCEAGPGSEESQATMPRIFLVQGMPKGPRMDLVIRQATEAGVWAILPLLSSRTVGGDNPGNRSARWERIVREALQQSGSGHRTELVEPLSLADLPAALSSQGILPSDPRILLHEAPLAQSSMHGYLSEAPEAVVLCVGPEGGFASDEVDFLLSQGFSPLRLAGAILRAETAALYAVAAAQIILSERSSWIPRPQ